LRFYQTMFKTLNKDLFAGIGYYYDYFWDTREVDIPPGTITDFQKYGLTPKSRSSGLTLNLLYDLRRNSINPKSGWYGNVVYRYNMKALGSDGNWSSLMIDLRKYFRFPANSNNIIGFWSYNVLTLHGTPPYLALPFTGSDTYINSGRGYIQGRFRGKDMVYLESEYRFTLTHDGFLGGVVFANVQSFSETNSKRFEMLWPACGAGLRFKLNKFSNTNVAIDYGFGIGGSHGIFVNLGEVF
jgi:outer membrane protein assembly factor BamA